MKYRRVIHQPPAREIIAQFARDACQKLSQQGDPSFEDPDVAMGLADFLNLIANILAKNLNETEDNLIDKV
jgi:hypothetical protein